MKKTPYIVLFNRTVSIYRFDPRHYTHPKQKASGKNDRYRQPYSRYLWRYYWYVFNLTWWARPEGKRYKVLDEPYQLDKQGRVISFAYTDIAKPDKKLLRKMASKKVFREDRYFFIVLPHHPTIRIYGNFVKVMRYCRVNYCRLLKYNDDYVSDYKRECKKKKSKQLK